jgi:hypothetical protein
MYRFSCMAMFAFGGLTLAARTGTAQTCYYLTYGCEGGVANHYLSTGGSAIGAPFHSSCLWCDTMQNGGAYPCHYQCDVQFATVMAWDAHASAVLAAARGDAHTLLALRDLLGDRLRFHAGRQAIQLMSCSGDESVIASLPVRGPTLVAAARALPPAVAVHVASR